MAGKKKPTLDERLEAIIHTLELVAAMQMQTEKKLDVLEKNMDRLEKFSERFAEFTFTNIVSQHKRIKKLEAH